VQILAFYHAQNRDLAAHNHLIWHSPSHRFYPLCYCMGG